MGVNDDLCHNAEQKIRKKRLLLQMWNTTKETAEKGQNSNTSREEYFACYMDCHTPNNNWLS